MWFGNLLIRIGICCNSEMLGLMAGGVFWCLCIVSSLSLVFTSISVKVVK